MDLKKRLSGSRLHFKKNDSGHSECRVTIKRGWSRESRRHFRYQGSFLDENGGARYLDSDEVLKLRLTHEYSA